MIKLIYWALINISFLTFSPSINAEQILWRSTITPMQEAGEKGLETLLVWPDNPGKHPIALISHGSPRNASERREMTAIHYLPIAMEFARRGFAVAVVLRRGYGHSGGHWGESFGKCNATSYPHAAFESSKDLHAAIDYLAKLPQFDINQIVPVGVSAGGFATIALTAFSPPKGLLAGINFAGGRGSYAADKICQKKKLISTFGLLGKTSRAPMLWVYAKNDHFFNSGMASELVKAFNSNGGNATFVQAAAFGKEGHYLFSREGIPVWTILVDNYLKDQPLNLFKEILPLPKTPHLVPPSELSAKNRKSFLAYLRSPPHKAFAIDSSGAFSWVSGRYDLISAKEKALENCEEYSNDRCRLYAVEDKYAE